MSFVMVDPCGMRILCLNLVLLACDGSAINVLEQSVFSTRSHTLESIINSSAVLL